MNFFMGKILHIMKAMLFVIVVILFNTFINILIGFLLMFCQRIHIIFGLLVFAGLWKFLLPLVTLIYKQAARINPFPILAIVIAWLIFGGECLLGIIGIIYFIIKTGISFPSIMSAIILIAMSIRLFYYSFAGLILQE